MSNPKDAIGRSKPGISMLPIEALFKAGAVMQLGAEKYGAYNWRRATISASVYYNAMMRHLARWWEGEYVDEESGQPHLAHIIANAAILIDAHEGDHLDDDRPPGRKVSF